MKKITTKFIKESKGKNAQKLTMITAYDALFAKIFDAKVDMILIGDSLEMSFGGKNDTLKATMDNMLYHTKAVCAGAKTSLIIMDMPFGSVNDKKTALKNASRVYQDSDADAIKIECNADNMHIIEYLCKNQIAVMAHIGLTPQSSRSEGGYIVKGKDEKNINDLIKVAKMSQDAGAFSVLVEGVTNQAAKMITEAVDVPVIGIGAGNSTDGQVLVWSDMLGFFDEFKPKFVRRFLDGKKLVEDATDEYIKAVKSGNFPSEDESYRV
ncbi:MAG: 3-methyl-2-oxobutanoate hydroxymethyltransferase [Campylobacter sp.]|nr:3-methyl-2-oxobutanoate hydroxymethyltransferase [Campylobacter sp.]